MAARRRLTEFIGNAGLLSGMVLVHGIQSAVFSCEPAESTLGTCEKAATIGIPDQRVSTQTYGSETAGQVMGGSEPNWPGGRITPRASGGGGTSSSTGCRKVEVNNNAYTVLGARAYTYRTWTRWCWTRSTQTVYSTSVGWEIPYTDGFQYWRGEVGNELLFYDYSTNDGHPRSAYYYNGTWVWETGGN